MNVNTIVLSSLKAIKAGVTEVVGSVYRGAGVFHLNARSAVC